MRGRLKSSFKIALTLAGKITILLSAKIKLNMAERSEA